MFSTLFPSWGEHSKCNRRPSPRPYIRQFLTVLKWHVCRSLLTHEHARRIIIGTKRLYLSNGNTVRGQCRTTSWNWTRPKWNSKICATNVIGIMNPFDATDGNSDSNRLSTVMVQFKPATSLLRQLQRCPNLYSNS